jgi:hypothetical protein
MPLLLEDLNPDAQVTGLIGHEAVRIFSIQMMVEAANLVYGSGQGNLQSQILSRDKEEIWSWWPPLHLEGNRVPCTGAGIVAEEAWAPRQEWGSGCLREAQERRLTPQGAMKEELHW